jgi:hypothetical protein
VPALRDEAVAPSYARRRAKPGRLSADDRQLLGSAPILRGLSTGAGAMKQNPYAELERAERRFLAEELERRIGMLPTAGARWGILRTG